MNFQIESDELPLIESTQLSTFSTGEEDYPLPNEEVSVLNSSVSHPNTSFVPVVAFHPDQTNEHDSSTLNGSLDYSEETNLPNAYPVFFIPENIQESSLDLSFFHTSNQNSQLECTPEFEVITKSSQKGKYVLIEIVGYFYAINIRWNMVNYWAVVYATSPSSAQEGLFNAGACLLVDPMVITTQLILESTLRPR